MSYLDQLKQEAEKQRQQELAAQQQQAQQQTVFRTKVKPVLQKMHKYLYEMVQQLNAIKADTCISYHLEGYGQLENFRQVNYIMRGDIELEHQFFLRFDCTGGFNIRIEKRDPRQVKLQKEYLHQHNMRFTCTDDTVNHKFVKTIFEVEPIIFVEFEFVGNVKTSTIDLTVRNFAELGKKYYTIHPPEVTDAFLDELAKYILRQPNELVLCDKYQLPTEHRKKLDEHKRKKDLEEFNQWLNETQEKVQTLEEEKGKNDLLQRVSSFLNTPLFTKKKEKRDSR